MITVEKGAPHADCSLGEPEPGKTGLARPLRVTPWEPPGDPPIRDVLAIGSSEARVFPYLKIHDPLKTIKILRPFCIL